MNRCHLNLPCAASAADEQNWNERALAQPVSIPTWRVWRYTRAAIVLGRSQLRLLQASPVGVATETERLVRRSGGGAVLVGPWMVSVSVALPLDHRLVRDGPVPSYRWLGSALARVLRQFGVPAHALSPAEVAEYAERSPQGDAAEPDLRWACFAGLSPWEAVAGMRKITGLAQARGRTGVLLVAGVLLARPDWHLLCAALGQPAAQADALARATTSCAEEGAPALAPETIARAIDLEITRVLGSDPGAEGAGSAA